MGEDFIRAPIKTKPLLMEARFATEYALPGAYWVMKRLHILDLVSFCFFFFFLTANLSAFQSAFQSNSLLLSFFPESLRFPEHGPLH